MSDLGTVTFGYFSMKVSASAFANFSIEVEPANVMEPLKSAASALFSVVSAAASLSALVSAALVSAALVFVLLEPHPTIPVARTAAPNTAIVF